MLCSTIIPTINRPSFERALKSAVAQDLSIEEHEIIVVNDSGMPLPDVAWLQSPQIKIVNTNRCERSVACNTGAANATGKYLKILQDDDYLLPGALRALINLAEATGCAWVYGASNRVDDRDMFMSLNQPDVGGNLLGHSVAGDCLHLSVSLLRRDVFFAVGCFDPVINTAEDVDLQCRISQISDIQGTTDLVANIRVGVWGNTSTQWNKKQHDSRVVREKALNAAGTLRRVMDSVKGDIELRGRCCRAYLISALLNFDSGRVLTGISRLLAVMPLTSYHFVQISFWQGLTMRSHWHKNEMEREYEYYRAHFPDKSITRQTW